MANMTELLILTRERLLRALAKEKCKKCRDAFILKIIDIDDDLEAGKKLAS